MDGEEFYTTIQAGGQITFACLAAGPFTMVSNGPSTCTLSSKQNSGKFTGTTGKITMSYTEGTEKSISTTVTDTTSFTAGATATIGFNYLAVSGSLEVSFSATLTNEQSTTTSQVLSTSTTHTLEVEQPNNSRCVLEYDISSCNNVGNANGLDLRVYVNIEQAADTRDEQYRSSDMIVKGVLASRSYGEYDVVCEQKVQQVFLQLYRCEQLWSTRGLRELSNFIASDSDDDEISDVHVAEYATGAGGSLEHLAELLWTHLTMPGSSITHLFHDTLRRRGLVGHLAMVAWQLTQDIQEGIAPENTAELLILTDLLSLLVLELCNPGGYLWISEPIRKGLVNVIIHLPRTACASEDHLVHLRKLLEQIKQSTVHYSVHELQHFILFFAVFPH
ncbi:hypothetical protein B0H13DRAFT_2300968 [Mycena leptocephala]|nr:hypothetical protein B0H13DRAFT_2300968 [Mycena leptocephala]